MAALTYKDDHNKVAYLEKSKGSEEYHQILDFLNGSTLSTIRKRAPKPFLDMDDQSIIKFDSGSESEGELVT
ncbi:hypothetical protein Tco_0341554 [Tanacetum coccineum]